MNNKREREVNFTPRTALGRTLWNLRKQIIKSGVKLLNADEVLEDDILLEKARNFMKVLNVWAKTNEA